MRAIRVIAAVVAFALALPAAACAAGWGGIEPGDTTLEQVRERYGAPSKETRQKTESYDTTTWIYEGPNAPVGMKRMTVDFGILKPDGYNPNLVRVFVLEPKPTIFAVQTVIDGWGPPSTAGDRGGYPTMIYEEGLVAVFDKQALWAEFMTFTMPQPVSRPPAASPPAQAPPKSSTAPKPAPTSPAGPRP